MKIEMLIITEEGEQVQDVTDKALMEDKFYLITPLYFDPFCFESCYDSAPYRGRPTSRLTCKSGESYTIVQSAESLDADIKKAKSQSVFKIN